MIGQKRVRDVVGSYITNNSLPHFLIFVGAKGQGKKTLANALAKKIGALVYIPEDMKVDAVRAILADAVTLYTPKMYLLSDAGDMTVQAQNALLKLAEEPPENAYIVLTVEDKAELLPTIISRSVLVYLEGYTRAELEEVTSDPILLSVCDNFGQIEEYSKIDYKALYEHCQKVANNLNRITSANSFNILKTVDPEYYDLFVIFLIKVLAEKLRDSAEDQRQTWYKLLNRAYAGKQLILNKSINKTNALEMMLLEMREMAWQ